MDEDFAETLIRRHRSLNSIGEFVGVTLDKGVSERFEALAAECGEGAQTLIEAVRRLRGKLSFEDGLALGAHFEAIREAVQKLKDLPDHEDLQRFATWVEVHPRNAPGHSPLN